RLLDVAHAPAVVAEFRARCGVGQRVAQAAELVDQAPLLRLRAAPDTAACDQVDLLDAALARGGDLADEVAVALVDHALDHAAHFGLQRAGGIEGAGEARGAHAVGAHADPLQRA